LKPARLRTRDTLAARWAKLAPHAEVLRPEGAGPWPVALMFHGCGGRRSYLDGYMRAAADVGVMAVSIDSFAHRKIPRSRALVTVCTGAELPGWQRAGDVLASLYGVSRLDGADPDRIALAGWSHGGWAIMDLMTMALARPGEAGIADPDPALLAQVKALFLAYPYCGPGALSQLRPWRRTPEVFACVGEKDRVAHPALCRRAFRQIERAGAPLETWFLPGATHAFDEDSTAASFFRFDEADAAEARIRMAGFLGRVFPT
jgi:dienelactone hydrolase